jgi:hypothetical protein
MESATLGEYLTVRLYKDNHDVREACYFIDVANFPGTVALAVGAISRQWSPCGDSGPATLAHAHWNRLGRPPLVKWATASKGCGQSFYLRLTDFAIWLYYFSAALIW